MNQLYQAFQAEKADAAYLGPRAAQLRNPLGLTTECVASQAGAPTAELRRFQESGMTNRQLLVAQG